MKQFFETPSCKSCHARLKNVFCALEKGEIENLTEEKSCNIYRKGQLIFYEGNRPTGLYCVNKGKIKLFRTGFEGKEQIVRFAKDGDILGYRALISGDVYAATAETLEDATVCFIPKKIFQELLQKSSELSTRVMQLLSKDLKLAETRITTLAQKPVRERMAEALLMLKEFYGFEQNNQTINAMLTREDLANIVGTATETAIRIMSDFRNEKMIISEGKKIKIINLPKLLKTANIYD